MDVDLTYIEFSTKKEVVLLDALPYIDGEYTPEIQKTVKQLVEEEMKTLVPPNYLEENSLRTMNFEGMEIMQKEFARMSSSENLNMPPLDTQRYSAKKPPPNYIKNLEAWQTSLENVKAQIQNQYNWIENLELAKLYGANAWKLYNEGLVHTEKSLEQELTQLKKKVEEINWERKKDQTHAGEKLSRLEGQWIGLVKKNLNIQLACHQLTQEIAALRKEVDAEAGVTSAPATELKIDLEGAANGETGNGAKETDTQMTDI